MELLEELLRAWRDELCTEVPVHGLMARNKVAHKWKATYRCLMVREASSWRVQDLLWQSLVLHQQGHGLGARILLRSAIETFATLVHLNQLMKKVVDGALDFHEFDKKTTVLLAGSRIRKDGPQALSILTVLEKCEPRYPGLSAHYGELSESAHPNWDGLMWGYSKVDHDEHSSKFSNRWMELHAERHLASIKRCMDAFLFEYDEVWPPLFEALERWLEENDEALEASRENGSKDAK